MSTPSRFYANPAVGRPGGELTRRCPHPYRGEVRCPYCGGSSDRVVDSRTTDAGAAIRRRRACLLCGRRYTTFERVEEVVLFVRKRSGHQEPFDQGKLQSGIQRASKNRPIPAGAVDDLVDEVTALARAKGPVVATDDIGRAVLERLRGLDEVTYLRFASVYKGFEDATDFAREVGLFQETGVPEAPARGSAQPEPAN
jgi:transcriptional repressor NrdR